MNTIDRLKEFSKTNDLASTGLCMSDELIDEWYDCSPKNCLAFASTGGDGVHFGVLKGREVDKSPVVMTVPSNFGDENMVIAETIMDFLRLGCRFGYFELEQLSYDFDGTIARIEIANESVPEDWVLKELANQFSLTPLANVSDYVTSVNQEHQISSRLWMTNRYLLDPNTDRSI